MNLHKKIGLFLLICIIPRAYCRFFKKLPPPLPDTLANQKTGVRAHLTFYIL